MITGNEHAQLYYNTLGKRRQTANMTNYCSQRQTDSIVIKWILHNWNKLLHHDETFYWETDSSMQHYNNLHTKPAMDS